MFLLKEANVGMGTSIIQKSEKKNDAGDGRDNCSQNIVVLKKNKNGIERQKGELSLAKDIGQQKYVLMYTWTYFQGKNRDVGTGNGLWTRWGK